MSVRERSERRQARYKAKITDQSAEELGIGHSYTWFFFKTYG